MKKHVLTKFICAAIVAAFGVGSAVAFGGCNAGDAHVEYALSDDGTYYIVSGVSGDREGLTSYEVPATYSAEEGGQALPVKEIGDSAFFQCSGLTSVSLPDTIEKIGASAFAFCSFEKLTIPESVAYIGRGAFGACSKLKEITVPESVTTLEPLAFYSCSSLETAYVKANINVLDDRVFYNNVYQHGGETYFNTSLTKVYLNAGIQKIRSSALAGNAISDIYFAGTQEQWGSVYFFDLESDGDGFKEKKLEKNEVLASSVKVTCDVEF